MTISFKVSGDFTLHYLVSSKLNSFQLRAPNNLISLLILRGMMATFDD